MRVAYEVQIPRGRLERGGLEQGYVERFQEFVRTAEEREQDSHEATIRQGMDLLGPEKDLGLFVLGLRREVERHITQLRELLREGYLRNHPDDWEALQQFSDAIISQRYDEAQRIGISLFVDKYGDFDERRAHLTFATVHDIFSHQKRAATVYDQVYEEEVFWTISSNEVNVERTANTGPQNIIRNTHAKLAKCLLAAAAALVAGVAIVTTAGKTRGPSEDHQWTPPPVSMNPDRESLHGPSLIASDLPRSSQNPQ